MFYRGEKQNEEVLEAPYSIVEREVSRGVAQRWRFWVKASFESQQR